MPLYRVDESGQFLPFEATPFPDLERILEDWLEANPHLLLQGETVAFIARQPRTTHGKFLDLLGVDESGACVVVELKRGETPREVVAQALEYAAWVDSLTRDQLDEMAREYALSRGISADGVADLYRDAFAPSHVDDKSEADITKLRTDHITFNNRQRLVIVAERFTGEVEQTIRYLRTRLGIDITALQFGVHRSGQDMIVQTNVVAGREPLTTATRTSASARTPEAGWSTLEDEIIARAKSDFVRSAVRGIEAWVASVGNPDLTLRRSPGGGGAILIRGKGVLGYYYAQNWVFCILFGSTMQESDFLRSHLSKADEVKERPDGIRFHLASDTDFEALRQVLLMRL